MIGKLILVFFASLAFVGLKASQNLVVVAAKYWAIMPLSLMIEVAGVYYIASVAHLGFDWRLILASGLGAGVGCMIATWFHYRRKRG